MINSIHHINIVVSDLEQSKAFFRLLGFTTIRSKELSGEWVDKVVGLKGVKASYVALGLFGEKTVIELLQYHSPKGDLNQQIGVPNQIGIRHIAFEVDKIDLKVESLKEKGIEFVSDVQTNPYGKKMCYFKGPDGILLELCEV